jgi:hypothetical protein
MIESAAVAEPITDPFEVVCLELSAPNPEFHGTQFNALGEFVGYSVMWISPLFTCYHMGEQKATTIFESPLWTRLSVYRHSSMLYLQLDHDLFRS